MPKDKNTKVGIGFATGRKSFQKVLRTTIHNLEGIRFGEKQKD